MARYRGPRTKIARRFADPIFGEDKSLERKNYPPGQHGFARKRGKKSEYALQLEQKQKAKYTYGILERQFRNIFEKANRMPGITGETLLQLCESRLDNIIFRMGISPTRRGARQFVNHGHVEVNQRPTNIPSYTLKPGDVISVRDKSKNLKVVVDSLARESEGEPYDWIQWNPDKREGVFLRAPERMEIPENINEQLIVELYSK